MTVRAAEEGRDGLDELGQPLCPLARARAVLAYVRPLAGRVTCAEAQQHPARREGVKSGRVRRHVHRLADTGLHDIRA